MLLKSVEANSLCLYTTKSVTAPFASNIEVGVKISFEKSEVVIIKIKINL